jgi:soluble lytic murein transglycosylase-like protein
MPPIGKERASEDPPSRPGSSSFPAIPDFPVCRPRPVRRVRFVTRICVGIALAPPLGARPADAGTTPASTPSAFEIGDPFAAWITEASRRFDIPASWIRDVMRVESRGNVRAVSPKGAIGLMQIMPETWAVLRARYGLGANPYDPHDNILAGAAYLRELHDRYGAAGSLAAYNAGPARYEDHLSTGRPLPGETRGYIGQLAPMVAGEHVGDAMIVAVAARSSTAAPLFVVRADRSPSASLPSSAVQPTRSSPVAPVADLTGLVPQADDLFVPTSHRNALP